MVRQKGWTLAVACICLILLLRPQVEAADSIDLSVTHLSLETPVVDCNSYTGVNVWLKVDLEGARKLTPDGSTDVYKVQLFLSTDKTLDRSDRELSTLPAHFAKVSTAFTVSGLLDLSGPGLFIPNVRQDDQKYCGPVNLIVSVDGAKLDGGQITEKDEDNNVMVTPIMIKCAGDKRALVDFTYKFGPFQTKIFLSSAIPVMVSAVIYNTDPLVPFYPGHANFRLSLWLHTEEDITAGSPLEITDIGTNYTDGKSPLLGVAPFGSVHVKDALLWVDKSKYISKEIKYKYLLLKVDAIGSSDDEVMGNNARAQSVMLSDKSISQQLDVRYRNQAGFDLRSDQLHDPFVQADGTMLAKSEYDQYKNVLSGTLYFYQCDVLKDGGLADSMEVNLYWSKDTKWDESDVDSGVALKLKKSTPSLVMTNEYKLANLMPPEDKSFCGVIYAIVKVDFPKNENENPKYNNFVVDDVILKCNLEDTLGLTSLTLIDPPIFWADRENRLTFELTVSCVSDSCDAFTNTEKNFDLKLFLHNAATPSGPGDSANLLKEVRSDSDAEFTNDGLKVNLTRRRATIQVTVMLTVAKSLCNPDNKYLQVELHQVTGNADPYMDNNRIVVELPPMQCDDTIPFLDLSVKTFELSDPLKAGVSTAFQLTASVDLSGMSLSDSVWPHFDYKLYVSKDMKLDADFDYEIPYSPPLHQFRKLTSSYSSPEDITLDDRGGFFLPSSGLERFCGGDVYIGVLLDSYDLNDLPSRKGKFYEPSEINNVMWSTNVPINGLKCDLNKASEKKLLIEVSNIEGPALIWDKTESVYSMQVTVTNVNDQPVRAVGTDKNFEIKAFLTMDGVHADTDKYLTVTVDDENWLSTGIVASGSITFSMSAKLCSATGKSCADINVLLSDECKSMAAEGKKPTLLFSLQNIPESLGLAPGPAFSIPVTMQCTKEVVIEILHPKLFSDFWVTGHEFRVMIKVNVTNFNKVQSTGFKTTVDNFHLAARITEDTNSVILSIPTDLPLYRQIIPAGGSVVVNVPVSGTLTAEQCATYSKPILYMKATELSTFLKSSGYDEAEEIMLDSPEDFKCHAALVHLAPSGGGTITNYDVSVTDFINLSIIKLQLMSNATDSEDNNVTLLSGKSFNLEIKAPAGQNGAIGEISFWLEQGKNSVKIKSPFGSVQTEKLAAIQVGTEDIIDLGSKGLDDRLVISAEEGGYFCERQHEDLFLVIKVIGTPVDLDETDNEARVKITLKCIGDVFSVSDLTGLPSSLITADVVALNFSVDVHNVDKETVLPSTNGKPVFNFELHWKEEGVSNTIIPLVSLRLQSEDQSKLYDGLSVGETLHFKDVHAVATINAVTCDKINTGGALLVKVISAEGRTEGSFELVMSNNIMSSPVTCSDATAELGIQQFRPSPFVRSDSPNPYGEIPFSLAIKLELAGGMEFTDGSSKHFDFKVWLSHDDKLDKEEDFDLGFDTSNYPELSAAYASDAVVQLNAHRMAVPNSVVSQYCGHVFLIAEVDSASQVPEPDETNNVKAEPVYITCDGDIYHVDSLKVTQKDVYFPEAPSAFIFDVDVYNMSPETVMKSFNLPNFVFKLYAQKGTTFSSLLATDITPPQDTWKFAVPNNKEHFTAYHASKLVLNFVGVTMMVNISAELCSQEVDHLILGVVVGNPALPTDFLMYNNYVAHPITCRINPGATDLSVKLDPNGNLPFKLNAGRNIILGQLKTFKLDVSVDIIGLNGGWGYRSVNDPPAFTYKLNISRGEMTREIPFQMAVGKINSGVTTSTTLKLDAKFTLSKAEFVPLCSSGLQLTVVLDADHQVAETNELNNKYVLDDIVIIDGDDANFCTTGFDIAIVNFEILPRSTHHLVAGTGSKMVNFDIQFEFVLSKGPSSSATLPTQFKYKLIMSPDKDPANSLNIDVASSEATYSDMAEKMVQATSHINSEESDVAVQQFCGEWFYLGVMVDSNEAIEEIDEDNNYAWASVFLNCPGITAIGLVIFNATSTDQSNIITNTPTKIVFNAVVMNRGDEIMAQAADIFDFEFYLSPNSDLTDAKQLQGVMFKGLDTPSRMEPLHVGHSLSYVDIEASINPTVEDIIGNTYMCLKLVTKNQVKDSSDSDNVQCVDLTRQPVLIDAIRDVSIKPDTFQASLLGNTPSIYQNSEVPMSFMATMVFNGARLGGTSALLTSFEFFLSDKNDIRPDMLNNQQPLLMTEVTKTQLNEETMEALSGDLFDKAEYAVSGETKVYVSAENCATSSRYLCVHYKMLVETVPVFRDGDVSNDFQCTDISALLKCTDETKDVQPIWFGLDSRTIRRNEKVPFELQVKISFGGTSKAGNLPFQSSFYLSQDDKLNTATDIQLSYDGFGYGPAKHELDRVLPQGETVLYLSGPPIVIPDSVDDKYCGPAYMIYSATTDIEEQYGTNNEFASPIILICDNGALKMSGLDIKQADLLVPGFSTPISFSFFLQNFGADLALPSHIIPNYVVKVYASTSDTVSTGSQVDITPRELKNLPDEYYESMKSGAQYELNNLQGYTNGDTFNLAICNDMTHLLVCVEWKSGGSPLSDCGAYATKQKYCKAENEQADIRVASYRVPKLLSVPGTMDLEQNIAVSLGSSADGINARDFVSSVYLSHDALFNKDKDMKLVAKINNEVAQQPGETGLHKVSSTALPIAVPKDKRYCGLVYMLLVLDSTLQVPEISELNNIGPKRVTVVCPGDYFSLTDPEFDVHGGVLIEHVPLMFDLSVIVTCAKHDCNLPSAKYKVRFELSSTHDPNGGASPQSLGTVSNTWGQSGGEISPPWGVGFTQAGQTRPYKISGSMTLPRGECGEDGHINLEVKLVVDGDGIEDNNIVSLRYPCTTAKSRDLVATNLTFLAGSTLTTLRPNAFSLQITLTGDAIPPMVGTPPVAPFTVAFFASDDAALSGDDVQLEYSLTESTAGDLQKGVSSTNSPFTLKDVTSGVSIPAGVCGLMYILALIDDTERVMETTRENNIADARVHIDCRKDLFRLVDVQLERSTYIWQDQADTIHFSMTVTNVAVDDILSDDKAPSLQVFAVLSENIYFEPLVDARLGEVAIPEAKVCTLDAQLLIKNGLRAGESMTLRDLAVNLTVPAASCSKNKYLLVGVLPASQQPFVEEIFQNNYYTVPLPLKCQGDLDLSVVGFTVEADNTFTLRVSATLGKGVMLDSFTYSLWLSTDDEFHPASDLNLNYKVPKNKPFPLTYSDDSIDLGGTYTLPTDIGDKFCGTVYMLAVLDENDRVQEWNEMNNVASNAVTVPCSGSGVFSMSKFYLTSSPEVPASQSSKVSMQVLVSCLNNCPRAPMDDSQVHYTFNVQVYDEDMLKLGVLDPENIGSQWVATTTEGLTPATGLTHDFTMTSTVLLMITGSFALVDPHICERVRYVGLEMQKGNSAEMSYLSVTAPGGNVRMTPLRYTGCTTPRADLKVNTLKLLGGATDLDLMKMDVLEVSLFVSLTAPNGWPMNDEHKPLFHYKLLVSSGDTLDDTSVNLDYWIPDNVRQKLKVDMGSKVLDLTDTIVVDPSKWRHLCGVANAHLWVVIDDLNEIVETDETNNQKKFPINVHGCNGVVNGNGLDLKMVSFPVPARVNANQLIPVDISVAVVIIGNIGLAQKEATAQKYDLTFHLVDDVDTPKEVHPLPYDTSNIDELRATVMPPSLEDSQKHKATKILQHLTATPELKIPPDSVLCGRSWFLRAGVNLKGNLAGFEIDPKDNYLYRHIYIICPDDQLSLHHVEVTYMPASLWTSSTNYVSFIATAVNSGSDIAVDDVSDSVFSLEMYLSVDDVLHTDTDTKSFALVTQKGVPYAGFKGGLKHGQIADIPILTGGLSVGSQESCLKMKADSAKPTLFWRLVPTNTANSKYSNNDALMLPLAKDLFTCKQVNIDLSMYDFTIMKATITPGTPVAFSMTIMQERHGGAVIPETDETTNGVSYKFEFFLSRDTTLSPDDTLVAVNYSDAQTQVLKAGVSFTTNQTIGIQGDNLVLDIEVHPEYQFYCDSYSFLIANVTDLKNSPSIDPMPENNARAVPILLICTHDFLMVSSIALTPHAPQTQLYAGIKTFLTLNMTLTYFGVNDIPKSEMHKPLFMLQGFLSNNKKLDIQDDPHIMVELGEDLKQQLSEGVPHLNSPQYSGEVAIVADRGVCTDRPKYFILAVLMGTELGMDEQQLENNYMYLSVENFFNCTLSLIDLEITTFDMRSVSGEISPGSEIPFYLSAKLHLYGSARLGTLKHSRVFNYQFYLSLDKVIDNGDLDLRYSTRNFDAEMTGFYVVDYVFPLSSTSEKIMIPAGLDAKYCGHVYLIAFIDNTNIVDEIIEYNNQIAVEIFIRCYKDILELTDVEMITEKKYYVVPGNLQVSYTVWNVLQSELVPKTNAELMTLKLHLQSKKPGSITHEITPAWQTSTHEDLHMTSSLAASTSVTFNVMANIDISTVCIASHDPIETGKVNLILEITQGGIQGLDNQYDCVPQNNMFVMEVDVNCSADFIDLSFSKAASFALTRGNDVPMVLGANPFTLAAAVRLGGTAGWTEALTDPLKFEYTFHIGSVLDEQLNLTKQDVITYDLDKMKAVINAATVNGKDIVLSDELSLPRVDYLYLCQAKEIELWADIDTKNQVDEANEANNHAAFSITKPGASYCTNGRDFSVITWSLKEDVLEVEETQDYILQLLLVLVGDGTNLIDITSSGTTHFKLKFFLSLDDAYDDDDVTVLLELKPAQTAELQKFVSDIGAMSLDADNLLIPLNNITYPYCWKRVFIGVLVDSDGEKTEVNENNNAATYPVILDCGESLNECERELYTCHEEAMCVDELYSLHTKSRGAGYKCVCKPGYKADGTDCKNVDECTERDAEGNFYPNCSTVAHAHCVDRPGSFLCQCDDGFVKESGSDSEPTCVSFDECASAATNNCSAQADCFDTDGSYGCVCNTGYTGDGFICENIDDCKESSCHRHGRCIDDVNDVECVCEDHYDGDYCDIANGNWGVWEEWGQCQAQCGNGIRMRTRECNDPAPSDKGRNCPIVNGTANKDEEPCNEGDCKGAINWCDSDPCQKDMGGLCFLLDEGKTFKCECNAGFNKITTGDSFMRCQDVDECTEVDANDKPLHSCHILATCTNTIGSFTCACPDGYSGDGFDCQDFDECLAGTFECTADSSCSNTPGGYTCSCNDGYVKQVEGKHMTCVERRLLEYGEDAGDLEVTSISEITGEKVSTLIKIPHGLPLAGQMALEYLYVSENGLIVATEGMTDDNNKATFRQPKSLADVVLGSDNKVKALIAAFWADSQTKINTSEIWYQAYTDTDNAAFGHVKTILQNTLDVMNFDPKFLLKVTWKNMLPSYKSLDLELNTFQALVVTDYKDSYAIFLYKAFAMNWMPIYSATDLQITYHGYPAWLGFAVRTSTGAMYHEQNENSGKWSTDPTKPNAYRVDQRALQNDTHKLLGVLSYKLTQQMDAYVNPRKLCLDWYNAEGSVDSWGAELLSNCPATEAQMSEDKRYMVESLKTSSGDQCATRLFPLANGANIRCCYKADIGSLMTAKDTVSATALARYSDAGFMSKYLPNDAKHDALDVKPFEWCCVQSKKYNTMYCQKYLEKRPMASAALYNKLSLGFMHGDPHITTLDNFHYSYNGYGEYVMLRSRENAPLYMLVQARTTDVPEVQTKQAAKLSAIAIQVGSKNAPKVQVYMKPSSPKLYVYIDSTPTSRTVTSYSGIDIRKSGSSGWRIIFKEGLFLTVNTDIVESFYFMRAMLAMSSHLQPGQFEGLWGNMNGNSNDDFVPYGKTHSFESPSVDEIYLWANTWSLREVYGQSDVGTSANDNTLFTQYGQFVVTNFMNPRSNANEYFNLKYKPTIIAADFNPVEKMMCTIAGETTPNSECLYDTKILNSKVGNTTLNNRVEFNRLYKLLSNRAPQFADTTPVVIKAKVGDQAKVPIDVVGPSVVTEGMTVSASVINSAGVEQLTKTNLSVVVSNDGDDTHYQGSLTWSPGTRDTYTLKVVAKDVSGATSEMKIEIILCACHDRATCDYTETWNKTGLFAYAGCKCPKSFDGPFCENDLDGCANKPCYGECVDRTPQQVQANQDKKEYQCASCPSGMEGNRESCADLNECLLPESNERRHKCSQNCTNTIGGYFCSCMPGFQLASDEQTCEDIPECKTARKFECDLVGGYCEDAPAGSFTCKCNSGLELIGKKCVDINECKTNNGGCMRKCINSIGSYDCECGKGFKPVDTDPKKCEEINECDLEEPECDQLCVDRVGYYVCACKPGFELTEDGKRCKPTTKCARLVCNTMAFCGVENGEEKCFCPHGYQVSRTSKTQCEDVDECSQNTHQCGDHSRCVNDPGDYHCQCDPGFLLNPTDSRRCDNINECAGDNVCQQLCIDNPGSFSCACTPGYLLQADGKTCADIDECASGQPNECAPNANCTNKMGSYECTCLAGFTGSGFTCNDEDECLENNGGCAMSCENVIGGVKCSCVAGYMIHPHDPSACIDVDECASPINPCSHKCSNTVGSYICSCQPGFQLDSNQRKCKALTPCQISCGGGQCYVDASGKERCLCDNGYRKTAGPLDECLDIQECVEQADMCRRHAHSVCIEQEGTYACTCSEGFMKNPDGMSCSDIDECHEVRDMYKHKCDMASTTCLNTVGNYSCSCKEGFKPKNFYSCADIDECAVRTHGCARHTAECDNLQGSYECRCRGGYVGDGKTCTDVNECLDSTANTCSKEEVCVNLQPLFECVCKPGFKRNIGTEKCEEVNECNSPLLNKCSYVSGCVNTRGSYHCSCQDGAVLANDGVTCLITDPCRNSATAASCKQLCLNVNGTDVCMCTYPLDTQCREIDECSVNNPCDVTHSTCVNKDQFFECHCTQPWIPDVDGLGCSETNGLWSEWTKYSDCSKACYGRQTRNRTCDNPPPVGQHRHCPGRAIDHQLCNVKETKTCQWQMDEIAASVNLTFEKLMPGEWESIETAFLQGVSRAVNDYCWASGEHYEKCCSAELPSGKIPQRDVTVPEDIRVTTTYPRAHLNGSIVMLYLVLRPTNDLCPFNVSHKTKRDLSAVLGRQRRASGDLEDNHYLNQTTFLQILDDGNSKATIKDELDAEDKVEYLERATYEAQKGEEPPATPAPTVAESPGNDDFLVQCLILVAVAFVLLMLFTVFMLYIRKKKRKSADGRVSPCNSQGSQTCLVVDSPCSTHRANTQEETTTLSHSPRHTAINIPPQEQEQEEETKQQTELERKDPENKEQQHEEPEQKEQKKEQEKKVLAPKEEHKGPYGSQMSVGHGGSSPALESSLPSADD